MEAEKNNTDKSLLKKQSMNVIKQINAEHGSSQQSHPDYHLPHYMHLSICSGVITGLEQPITPTFR